MEVLRCATIELRAKFNTSQKPNIVILNSCFSKRIWFYLFLFRCFMEVIGAGMKEEKYSTPTGKVGRLKNRFLSPQKQDKH